MQLAVTLFTDPACPFAFSAEPVRMRLRWHYGDGLTWRLRMIVLSELQRRSGQLSLPLSIQLGVSAGSAAGRATIAYRPR